MPGKLFITVFQKILKHQAAQTVLETHHWAEPVTFLPATGRLCFPDAPPHRNTDSAVADS